MVSAKRSLAKETAETLDLGDREVGDRLDRMIDASALDPGWVMDHIEDYSTGDDHIGKWQGYAEAFRWDDLAEKIIKDIEQLEKINSNMNFNKSRRCKIMVNIRNTKRQYFKRLDGPQDFELNEKELRMNEEYERTSASSSTTSSDSGF